MLRSRFNHPLWQLWLGAIAIGFAPIFVRLSELGPLAVAFWRMSLACLMLAAITCYKTKQTPFKLLVGNNIQWVYLAGIVFAADLSVWHFSIQYTSIATATLLCNLSPIILFLYEVTILKIKRPFIFWVFFVFAMVGINIFVNPHFTMSKTALMGNVLALFASFLVALYSVVIKNARNNFSALQVMFVSSFAGSIVLFFLTLYSSERFFPHHAVDWIMIINLALICHVVGQGSIANSLKHLPASFSSLVLIIQPIVATCCAWLLFSEVLSFQQLYGILMIIFALYWINKFRHV